ncbi:unnamed protein product [Sphacelaria rigidula]
MSGCKQPTAHQGSASFARRPNLAAASTLGLLVVATTSVDALLPKTPIVSRGCVRPRGSAGGIPRSTNGATGGEAESADSSEIYASLRKRLEELRHARHDDDDTPTPSSQLEWERLEQQEWEQRNTASSPTPQVVSYSGHDMKKAYYEAFWRARNLKKGSKTDEASSSIYDDPPTNPPTPPATTSSSSSDVSRPATTLLTTAAFDMVMSKYEEDVVAAAEAASTAPEKKTAEPAVQGLTQMFYLEEKDEQLALTTALAEAGTAGDAARIGANAAVRVQAALEQPWPVGLSQMFFVEDAHEEAAAAAGALPLAPRSFLRERLGVPGEIVQALRQVELDHARLAMLAVLLTGVVGAGAGAGVPASAEIFDSNLGLAALAQVARTPWLDPCVAGVILSVKALSEGDGRLGKGALAGWADKGLRAVSDIGAKALRLSSGDEMRKLAVEMEVKHGRMALGAVVCAMAQQGLMTVGA